MTKNRYCYNKNSCNDIRYDCGFQRVKAKDGQHHFRAKSKAPKDLSLLVDSLGFMINAILKMSSTVMSKNKDLLE